MGALKRVLGWPLRRTLDPRVAMTVHEIDARLGSENLARPTIHDRLDDLDRMGRDMLAGLGWRGVPTPGGALSELDAAHAAYLNWASGPDGYASQAGLWFNPPVPVHHAPGAVDVLLVNERIVEQPFVFGAIARLGGAARILDVGGSESTVGLSLATLGHDVTLVDPRAHPLRHANLTHAACRLDELPDDGERFEAAVVLSAIEHFGLEHYDVGGGDSDGDRRVRRPFDHGLQWLGGSGDGQRSQGGCGDFSVGPPDGGAPDGRRRQRSRSIQCARPRRTADR